MNPPAPTAAAPAADPLAPPRAGAPLRAAGWLFLAFTFGAPLFQLAYEHRRGKPLQAFDYFQPFVHGPGERSVADWSIGLGKELIDDQRLRRFETELHDVSFITQSALPPWQLLLTRAFGHGNEKAIPGRDGWLFFADDLKSAYGPGYLAAGQGGQEALAAIDDFRDQLEARGIQLLLIPSYSKELLDAAMVSRFSTGLVAAPNPDLERFYGELDARGHAYVRMDELFAARRAALADPDARLALPRDTHWSPETMAFCAERIAGRVRDLLLEDAPRTPRFRKQPLAIEGQGDLLRMLGLPADQTIYPPMQLTIEQVVDASGALVHPDPRSDLLLMGDSLTKVFSDPTLGLGEAAGLAEHLALHLDRPLDVIAIAGGSATQTREALARRPGDGLAGKRLVIWQFGVRMLASGPDQWQKVALPPPGAAGTDPEGAPPEVTEQPLPKLGQPIGTKGFTTDSLREPDYETPADVANDRVTLIGEITLAAAIPADFDYEFTLCVHELKVVQVLDGRLPPKAKGDRVWVAFPGRVEGEDLPPSRFTPGMRFELTLEDHRLRFGESVSLQFHPDANVGRNVIHYPLTWKEAPR